MMAAVGGGEGIKLPCRGSRPGGSLRVADRPHDQRPRVTIDWHHRELDSSTGRVLACRHTV